ncbi:MAG: hexitol phosphatase HxpB [Bacteroidetes bacterium]|nr:hexitol phosphatase HxpB [Bacteroidota bacterium]
MQLNTVIFDMDGLLIDSEPFWNEAAAIVFADYKIILTAEQYASTTGMRTKEFVEFWFNRFNQPLSNAGKVETAIINKVIDLVRHKGKAMPGLAHIINFFTGKGFKIGLASSSPMELIDVVIDHLQIRPYLQSIVSASTLPYGKPHPEVYLNCAANLGAIPAQCIGFEDSFPGMIAVKAAGMKCVVVPHHTISKEPKWHAADLRISSLQNFNALLLQSLG